MTAEAAVLQVGAVYAESLRDRNGRPRKRPFYKALALLKERMGVPVDGMIPQEVYDALRRLDEKGAAMRPVVPVSTPSPSRGQDSVPPQLGKQKVDGGTPSQFWSLKRARKELPKLFSKLIRDLRGKSLVKVRIACVRALKDGLGLASTDPLPSELFVRLIRLERQQVANTTNPTLPVSAKPRTPGPKRKKPKKNQSSRPSPRKQTSPRSFKGLFQELPERSVWTGAPWDRSFEKYRWM